MASAHAASDTLCTVADVDNGRMIRREGTCDTSVTAASTFKIAISLMGFDSGVLKDEHTPELPFREGYADWNPAWRTTTDPTAWISKSVVWYSQEITRALGEERFERYVREFQYGNQDVSGGPGAPDGLTSAWLSSSLKISPLGQLEFLEKFVRRELPVSTHAYEMTARLTDLGVQAGGWHVHGKTGSGLPRKPDGSLDRGRGYGWFVGWAERQGRTVVFARLIQNRDRQSGPPGQRARDSVIRDLFSSPDGPSATPG